MWIRYIKCVSTCVRWDKVGKMRLKEGSVYMPNGLIRDR